MTHPESESEGKADQPGAGAIRQVLFYVTLICGLSFIFVVMQHYRLVNSAETTFQLDIYLRQHEDSLLFPFSLLCLFIATLIGKSGLQRACAFIFYILCAIAVFYFAEIFSILIIILLLLMITYPYLLKRKKINMGITIFITPIVIFLLIFSSMLETSIRSTVNRAKSDMRTMQHAIEAYYADHNCYPPHTSQSSLKGYWRSSSNMPSFRGYCLTTPVAYLTDYLQDPLRFLNEERTFAYYAPEGLNWIMISAGPDCKYDINENILHKLFVESEASSMTQRLVPYNFDPTNGTKSSGDLFRLKQ